MLWLMLCCTQGFSLWSSIAKKTRSAAAINNIFAWYTTKHVITVPWGKHSILRVPFLDYVQHYLNVQQNTTLFMENKTYFCDSITHSAVIGPCIANDYILLLLQHTLLYLLPMSTPSLHKFVIYDYMRKMFIEEN